MTSTPATFTPDVTQRTAAANIAELSSRIAVLIPCYNEAEAIEGVVKDFAAALPTATIYVYDNNSTDETKVRAARAGAIVRTETFQGKGNVMRRMFADIEAEAYVLVDGDGTYDAASAAVMVDTLLANSLDMVNGSRVPVSTLAFRPGHVFGNKLLTGTVAAIFGNRIKDMLSGYRVFSRRFVKSFPALASGFETETELTVHALELRLPIAEIQTPYRDRPPGSKSKLNTFRDGFRILRTIVYLVKEERPMQFFSLVALALFAASLILGWPVIATYIETGLVPRLPTAVLAVGTMILSAVSFIAGLILDTVTLSRRELKRLHYLGLQGPTFRERRRSS
ncbi:glycosyltransferase [Steroidobacter sp.]|uniref:glycosyltransferase n=1 Tax=Steroidobacter sp. TaxID=1978227 RepID=UPI001A3CA0AA|nr:glycosyltransferase [Steroidobacter sp.]MBL8268392.1 glycosyltransferase [Steroidobacter sp.]